MIEAIKYFLEHSGIINPVFSGAILYYMIVMQTKIARIEENLKGINSKIFKIEKVEDKIHQLIINNSSTSMQVENIDKRVIKIEKDVETLKAIIKN